MISNTNAERGWSQEGRNQTVPYYFCLLKCAVAALCEMQKALKVTVRILIGKLHCFQRPTLDVVVPKNKIWENLNNTLLASCSTGSEGTCLTIIECDGHVVRPVASCDAFFHCPKCFVLFTPHSTLRSIVLDAANRLVCVFFLFFFNYCLFVFALGFWREAVAHRCGCKINKNVNMCVTCVRARLARERKTQRKTKQRVGLQ